MNDLIFASSLAIEGQSYLLHKWRGEYGNEYPADIKKSRCAEIQDNLDRLRQIRRDAKNA